MDIRGRLVGLAVGATIPLVLAAVVDLWGTWTDTRRQLNVSMAQQVEFAALAFEHWIDTQRQPLITAASYISAQEDRMNDILRVIIEPRPQWIDLRVVDSEGATLFSAPADAEPLPPGIFGKLMDDLRQEQSAVETDWSRGEGRYLLAIAEPLANGGAVIARIDGATTAEVFRYLELPTQSLITLLDPQRRIIYRSSGLESYVGADIGNSSLFQELDPQRGAVLIEEEESAIDETHRVYAVARAGPTRYLVTIGVPSETLYEPARRQLTIQLLLILVALCCTVIAALVIARSVVKPLRRLVTATRRFGKGEFSARVPTKGYTEIIELGDTFNEMAESITKREARLKELDELKSDFVSSVSHELRTPLTTIKTLTQLMMRRQMTESERYESLETISAECDRQIDLVLNLLDLTRIESGAFDFLHVGVDPVAIVQDCLRLQWHTAELRGHSLVADVSEELPRLYTDRGVLRRMLSGLIENAIKYTPDGGRITIGARATSDHEISFYVSDTGIGIAAKELQHIFKKFYRTVESGETQRSGNREVAGVGLGLYLTQNLIRHLGGRVEVVSEVGQGSTFTVFLPVGQDADADQAEQNIREEQHVATATTG